MKTTLIPVLISLAIPAQAFAISYYKNKDGAITKIQEDTFNSCSNIIYRSAAKDELAPQHKRALVSAMLKGEALNDLASAVSALKKTPDACTYGTDSEKFN